MKNFLAYALLAVIVSSVLNFTVYAEFDPLGGLGGGSNFDQQQPQPKPAYVPENTPVTDLDALTNPQPEPDQVQEKPQPTEQSGSDVEDNVSLTIAECLIMEQLEIEDKRCDKLKQAINCPEYTACIIDKGKEKDNCFASCNFDVNSPGCRSCREQYNAGLAVCEAINPACTAKYPTEKLTLPKSSFEALDPIGDVRITYEDNPRASDMQTIDQDAEALVGATIFTGDKGSVALRFSDNSTAFIGPNAYFRIDDFYASDRFEQTRTFLKNGSVRIMIRAKSEDENVKYSYVVMTPLWKAEAKGTEFEINVAEDGMAKLETFSGEVEISDYEGNLLATVPAGETYESKADTQSVDDGVENTGATSLDADSGSRVTYDFFEEQKRKRIILAAEIATGIILVGVIYFAVRRFRK